MGTLSKTLRQVAQDLAAITDAAERVRQIRVTVRVSAGTSAAQDRARAEAVARNMTPEFVAALAKKLGLKGKA